MLYDKWTPMDHTCKSNLASFTQYFSLEDTMKFYVEKNKEGLLLRQIQETKDDINFMEIQLRDGDTVETGHDPYPLLRIDSTKEEFYKK